MRPARCLWSSRNNGEWLQKAEGELSFSLFLCAPGRAHLLGGVSPLWTLMTGTISRTARAAAARRGLKEAERKSPARGTRSAYEAAASGREGTKIQSPIVIRKARKYMRRVYGEKVSAQYPGRSACLPIGYRRRETTGQACRSQPKA